MQLMLGKKHLGNERIYRKRMFAKSRIEIEILENLRKPLTRKSTRKRIDIDFKRVSFIYALARLTKIENVWFEAIRAILDFRVKFNEEFTRQAVNFSIELFWNFYCGQIMIYLFQKWNKNLRSLASFQR